MQNDFAHPMVLKAVYLSVCHGNISINQTIKYGSNEYSPTIPKKSPIAIKSIRGSYEVVKELPAKQTAVFWLLTLLEKPHTELSYTINYGDMGTGIDKRSLTNRHHRLLVSVFTFSAVSARRNTALCISAGVVHCVCAYVCVCVCV